MERFPRAQIFGAVKQDAAAFFEMAGGYAEIQCHPDATEMDREIRRGWDHSVAGLRAVSI